MSTKKIDYDEHPYIQYLYETGYNLTEIANVFSVTRESIAKILRKIGVSILNGNKRLAEKGVDLEFFDKDTESAAYFFGLLLSDGNISERGKVSMSLQCLDSHILEDFKSALGTNNKVSFYKRATGEESCQLVFTVSSIADSLSKLGMLPRKSLEEVAPERFLFDHHFWRGMVDGDGCITIPPDKKSPKIYLCGSRKICEQFLDFCKLHRQDISTKITHMKNGLYRTTITGNKAASILDILYKDAKYALDRKRSKAVAIVERYRSNTRVFDY